MSESQSRYSIVEKLTEKKLEIISQKLGLDEELLKKQQTVERLKKELSDWQKNIEQDNEREMRNRQREIENSILESSNSKERKTAKEKALIEKIETIDKALERIEEISKTSPTIQN